MNDIKKIKRLKNGGLEVVWNEVNHIKEDDMEFNKNITHKNDMKVHPDVIKSFDSFIPFVARILGLEKLPAKEMKLWKSDLNVNTIHLSGEENDGVIISSTYETESGQKIAINTPRIVLSQEIYGFEEKLQEAIDVLLEEARLYLKGKSPQLRIELEEAA